MEGRMLACGPRMTATQPGGGRFKRRPGTADQTMSLDTPIIDRCSCLAVVPAYNEEATVGHVVAAIRRKAPQLDVLVIDDGSTDTTADRAEDAGAQILRMPFNLGIGGAVQAGFKYADEEG